MRRSAPESGYDFGSKREYRRQVWATIRKSVQSARNAQVILMPSWEGDEIEVALSRGFREENIHAIDRSPAIVASAKWRKQYPLVKVYGRELDDACRVIAGKGLRVSAANLDLCGYAGSRPTGLALGGAAESGVFTKNAVIAVTVLRGRESNRAQQSMMDVFRHHTTFSLDCSFTNDARYNESANGHPCVVGQPCVACAITRDYQIGEDRKEVEAAWRGCRQSRPLESDVSRIMWCRTVLECATDQWEFGAHLCAASTYRSSAGSQTMLWCVMGFDTTAQYERRFKRKKVRTSTAEEQAELNLSACLMYYDPACLLGEATYAA